MDREQYLESLIPKDLDYEAKYKDNFDKYATYTGNGTYHWKGIRASCTMILFLTGVLRQEGIYFEEE